MSFVAGSRVTRLAVFAVASAVLLSGFLSLGVAAAPAPGPSSALCGTTIVTSVVLDSDLVCGMGGIMVGADGITIALNGHSITGPNRGAPLVGILVVGRTGVSIEGPGTVTNFRTGILIASSHDVTVKKVAENQSIASLSGSAGKNTSSLG